MGLVKVPEEPECEISSLSHQRAEERSQGRICQKGVPLRFELIV